MQRQWPEDGGGDVHMHHCTISPFKMVGSICKLHCHTFSFTNFSLQPLIYVSANSQRDPMASNLGTLILKWHVAIQNGGFCFFYNKDLK